MLTGTLVTVQDCADCFAKEEPQGEYTFRFAVVALALVLSGSWRFCSRTDRRNDNARGMRHMAEAGPGES